MADKNVAATKTDEQQTEDEDEETLDPENFIPIAACLILVIAGGLLVFAFTGRRSTGCALYLEMLASHGNVQEAELSAVQMHACKLSRCKHKRPFDLKECESPCPFGFREDEEGCPSSCECAFEGIVQGDIAFRSEQVPEMLEDFGHSSKKDDFTVFFSTNWEIWDTIEVNGRFKLPYTLDVPIGLYPDFPALMDSVVKNVSKLTCIDLVERSDEEDYIEIYSDDQDCKASTGRYQGKQRISLPHGCHLHASIQHELAHVLGFWHEQSRPDRDGYVDINLDNVEECKEDVQQFILTSPGNRFRAIYTYMPTNRVAGLGGGGEPQIDWVKPTDLRHNFDKFEYGELKELGVEYDLTSAMHYQTFDFAIDKSIPVITGKGGVIVSKSPRERWWSERDIEKINKLYDCKLPGPRQSGMWSPWWAWSSCTATCGKGTRKRHRYCHHQFTGAKIKDGCDGKGFEQLGCKVAECTTGQSSSQWSRWSAWNRCSATCGSGMKSRSRSCQSGNTCSGKRTEFEACYEKTCYGGTPTAGNFLGQWGDWDSWRRCDVTCGQGNRKRFRSCKKGTEKLSTDKCKVSAMDGTVASYHQEQSSKCDNPKCATLITVSTTYNPWAPVTVQTKPTTTTPNPWITPAPTGAGYGAWSDWSMWSNCDATCGIGQRTRSRSCNGAYCAGENVGSQDCGGGACAGGGLFTATTTKTSNICIYGKLLVGRFDDDNAHDLICVYPDGCVRVYCSDTGSRKYIQGPASWEGRAEVCSFVGKTIWDKTLKVFAADVNGDGRDDLVCVNVITHEIEVTLNSRKGYSKTVDWRGRRDDCEQSVAVKEMTGDKNSDLICGDLQIAFKHMYKSTGRI